MKQVDRILYPFTVKDHVLNEDNDELSAEKC